MSDLRVLDRVCHTDDVSEIVATAVMTLGKVAIEELLSGVHHSLLACRPKEVRVSSKIRTSMEKDVRTTP